MLNKNLEFQLWKWYVWSQYSGMHGGGFGGEYN